MCSSRAASANRYVHREDWAPRANRDRCTQHESCSPQPCCHAALQELDVVLDRASAILDKARSALEATDVRVPCPPCNWLVLCWQRWELTALSH